MSRYADNYRLIKWGDHSDWRKRQQTKQGSSEPFYFVPDIAPFQSPVDYSFITSRSQLREHEKRHNVRQCGELNKPEHYDNSHKRDEAFNERRFESAFRHALDKTGLL